MNSSDSRRPRYSVQTSATARSTDLIFLRPTSSSPCVFAVFSESVQKGREICFSGKPSADKASMVSSAPPPHHVFAGCTVSWATRDLTSSCFVFLLDLHLKKLRRAALDPHILTALGKTKQNMGGEGRKVYFKAKARCYGDFPNTM